MTPAERRRHVRSWQRARLDHAALKAAKADVDRQLADLRADLDALRMQFATTLREAKTEVQAVRASLDRLREIERAANLLRDFDRYGLDAPTLQ
jgi:hypothetical protein